MGVVLGIKSLANRLLNEEGWTDVGLNGSWWGAEDAEPTCHTHGAATATRIDAIIANAEAVAWVKEFAVIK